MLTTEELMLVNNLIYLEGTSKEHPFQSIFDRAQIIDDNYEGLTVGDFLDDVMKCPFTDNNNRAFISGAEWHATIRAIESNPKLLDLEIVTGQKDTAAGGGEGESVLLVDHNSKEAIFVFRGTADKEWYDDFYAGNVADTPQQENALDWYNGIMSNDKDYGYLDDYYITVTGHSKGGNKAKYITIVEENNPVDRCVSLDGQGFSDAFFTTYSTEISARQGLIENHNVEFDFVNLLLNDIGSRSFYKMQYFNGNPAEFHSPNSFYVVDLQGNLITQCTGSQPPLVMQEVDELINGLLRSMPSNMRSDALRFIGISFESFWNYMWTGRLPIEIPILLTDKNNWQIISYLMEYVSIDVLVSIYCNIVILNGGTIDETFINTFIDIWNQNCPIDLLDIDAKIQNGDDLIVKSGLTNADKLKNIKELIAAGAAAGVAAVATINAKNSEEEHLVHDNMYFGPSPVEEGAEQLISGAEQFAEIGVLDEEYEHKNDYGALSHGGGMYEHIGSAMDEAEEGYSGGYNSHGGAFYHDLEQEESGMGGAGSHGLSNGFQMGALAGLEVENNQNSAASFAGQLADNSHGFDEFVVGNGFSAAVLGGANVGANALSKNSKSFVALLNGMSNGREKLINASGHMSAAAMKVNAISNITIGTTNTEKILSSIKAEINQENNECKELHVSFSKITDIYRKNEESLTTKKYKNKKRLDSSAKPPLHPGMLHSPDFSHMIPHSSNHPEFIKPEMPSPEEWHDNHTGFTHPGTPNPEDWHDNAPGLALVDQDGEVIISTQDLQNIPSQIGNIVGTEMAQISDMFGVSTESPMDSTQMMEQGPVTYTPPYDVPTLEERMEMEMHEMLQSHIAEISGEPPLNPHPKNEPNMIRPEPSLEPHTPYEPQHDASDFIKPELHTPHTPQHDASDSIKPELHTPHEPQHDASDFIKPELHTPHTPQYDASDSIRPELHTPHEPQHDASDFIKPELHTPYEPQHDTSAFAKPEPALEQRTMGSR